MNPAHIKASNRKLYPDLREIEFFFEGRFPGVACVCATIDAMQLPLFPEEDEYVCKCVMKRRREFTAGRSAARLAMKKLGITPSVIPRGSHNEPLWPKALAGSISHADDICICVLALKKHYSAIGVDIENPARMQASFFSLIFSETEIMQLVDYENEILPFHATAAFSAKEAFFKFQYPLTRQWLNFKDSKVSIHGDKIDITLSPKALTKGLLPIYHGVLKITDKLIVTGFLATAEKTDD